MGAPCGCDVIRSKTIVPATAEHPTADARALFFGGSGLNERPRPWGIVAAAVEDSTSRRTRPTKARTVDSATVAPRSSTRRSQICLAVWRCLRGRAHVGHQPLADGLAGRTELRCRRRYPRTRPRTGEVRADDVRRLITRGLRAGGIGAPAGGRRHTLRRCILTTRPCCALGNIASRFSDVSGHTGELGCHRD